MERADYSTALIDGANTLASSSARIRLRRRLDRSSHAVNRGYGGILLLVAAPAIGYMYRRLDQAGLELRQRSTLARRVGGDWRGFMLAASPYKPLR
jgi:hypothetical protein